MPRLVYVDRQGVERSVPIGATFPRVTVGRNPDCTIQVTKPSVSRLHSEFIYNQGVLEVADLGSSNGTFINGREVKRQALRDRDEVKCGDFVLRVFMEDELAPPQPPPLPPPLAANSGGYQPQPTQLPTDPYAYGARPAPQPPSPYANPYATPTPPPAPAYEASAPRRAYSTTGSGAAYPAEPDPYASRSGSFANSGAQPAAQSADAQRLLRENQSLREKIAEQESVISFLNDDSRVAPLQAENEAIKRELADTRAERDKLRVDLSDRLRSSGDAESRFSELRREIDQKQLTIDSFQERYDRLKVQAEDQLAQLDEYRAEIKQKRETIEDLEYRHREIEQAHQKGSSHVAELIEESADLKVRVNQLERQLDEAQRNANLTEFELKKVRQENENLRLMIDSEGSENVGLQDEINHLRQVIEVKENDTIAKEREIEDLLSELDSYRRNAGSDDASRKRFQDEIHYQRGVIADLQREVEDLRERLRAAPANAAPQGPDPRLLRDLDDLKRENERLQHELANAANAANADDASGGQGQVNQLKRQNRDLRHQVEDLEDELARLRAASPSGSTNASSADPAALRDLQSQLRDLQADNDHLLAQLAAAAPAQGADPRELDRLKRDLRRLEDELEEARAQARRAAPAAAPAGGGGDVEPIKRSARELSQNLNDIVSTLRNNTQLMRDYITDIRKIYDAIARVDLQALPTVDRLRIEKTIREVEPEVTFEEIGHLLGDTVNDSEELKDQILRFRDVVLK